MKHATRLILVLAVATLFSATIYLQDDPVHAASGAMTGAGTPLFESQGRDIFVIDGDTIMINGEVVDLAGMDAPELGQQCLHNDSFGDCGMSSAMQLRKYFAMAPFAVRCWAGDQERSGKADDFPIVECGIGERDVAAAMITDGEALPIAGYSHRYDSLSTEANNASIGIHGGDMINPAEWRNGKRLDGETGGCLFRTAGTRHYIGTLDPRFADTATDGSTKICSDEEARDKKLVYLAPAP
ncbi:thermonuclease family protein [Thalassospira lucentensis]|uniref:thermonuclease family protein n=1 Tax=Thalassospira lucentensis TaxID=168935 RepID=UPI003D2EE821